MKNKKLFAILTLVCFMFTLMPVAAFAADTYVEVSKDSGSTWDDAATVTINNPVTVRVNDGSVNGFFVVDENGALDQVNTTGSITFDEKGTYKVYAAAASDVTTINGQVITKAAKLELLMELDSLVEDYATVKVKTGDVEYRILLADNDDVANVNKKVFTTDGIGTEYSMTIAANEGWDEDGNVTATLQKSTVAGAAVGDPVSSANWEDVKGAELTFSTAGYVDVVTADGKVTDRGGDVEFEVTSDRAGDYTMYVKYGNDAKVKLNVTVTTSTVANVAVEQVPSAPVNIAQTIDAADIEFKFVDGNNGAYKALAASDYKITVVSQPADSDMEADDFALSHQAGDDADGVYTLVPGNASYFAEEGEYVIKVTLKNGKAATATVKVAEQGDIVGIKFDVYNTPVTVAYGNATAVSAVLAYDANGVTSDLSADPALKLSASGKAVENFSAGALTVKDKVEYIGAKITVMAVYDEFVATTELTVVDEAAQVVYNATTAEAGVNTTLLGAIKDETGLTSGLGAAASTATAEAIVLDKPENAVAVVSTDRTLNSDGKVVLHFLASEAGDYKVQTIVTYNAGTVAEPVIKYISSIETITVGAGEGVYDDIVVMSIGANQIVVNSDVKAIDAAPIVENNRTFVPFRALAEAFGATVAYDEATQAITAELDGVKVVMTIGSAEYTVDGAAKTADVAPFINGSRTMVPVRFVAEAFGINVTPVYGENGATVDVLFAK